MIKNISGWEDLIVEEQAEEGHHQSDFKNKDSDNGTHSKTHLRKDTQSKMSPDRNYAEETPKTFFPPGMDVSAAKKSSKWKKKRVSKKNKNGIKEKSSPHSATSDKSGLDEDFISISEDSDIQEEKLSDDHENEANFNLKSSIPSMDQVSDDDIIVISQDSEKSTTNEQISEVLDNEDVNKVIEDVGSDNEDDREKHFQCVLCMTYFWSVEELDKHERSNHSSYCTQDEHFSDVSDNENIETDVDKESLSDNSHHDSIIDSPEMNTDHSEICCEFLGLMIKRVIVMKIVASLSVDIIMANVYILNVRTDPNSQQDAQHDLIEFVVSLKDDVIMDNHVVNYLTILQNMIIYAEKNPEITLPSKKIEQMSLSDILKLYKLIGKKIPPHSWCESVLYSSAVMRRRKHCLHRVI